MELRCPQCNAQVEPQRVAEGGLQCPRCGHPLAAAGFGAKAAAEIPTVIFTGEIEEVETPKSFGRYRVIGKLGAGGFGVVYRGYDDELQREVAIKVAHRHQVSSQREADAYLAEARILAKLDHPGIVPAYDVGRTEEGLCYLVSKFVEGCDLAARAKVARLSYREAARIVARVAEALHHAHKQGLVHRDIKPGNILLDTEGKAYVADFGVALREQDFTSCPSFAGTPAYMSPEQARGEGHRVDARSDVFSLGVVFYELLCGRKPFTGKDRASLLREITQGDPRPPRQFDDTIPKELDRICLKALAKRAADRYSTAKDLAEDLRLALAIESSKSTSTPIAVHVVPGDSAVLDSRELPRVSPPSSGAFAVKIVPRGLRSFDAEDADFFLELLPGPRDREGLPESVRFWKSRIEETVPEQTFGVGLIYGPSGCGKSSLVKAGLLPRIAAHVTPVFVEATPDDTEVRLLRRLSKRFPGLFDCSELPAALAALRRGTGILPGQKLLIVLDQFEQWLHAKREEENTELVRALRHCDGRRVQCVILVRDDFWMAVTRFMRELEVRLSEGENSAAVDLFDPLHARKILAGFGRAYARLSDARGELTREQGRFLDRAVAELARDGKIIPVRLALLAEMVKDKPWTPATLKSVGGMSGLGVTFLEETFSTSTAPPAHRVHQKAAREVLKALLPERGTDIRGHVRSHQELLEASGYARRPAEFDDLMRILDGELRLVTPTDPEGLETDDDQRQQGPPGNKYYLLTHDYLVTPLREWLTRKQRETARGRAALRLAERATLWSAKPERRHLPSWWEWADILAFTRRRERTESQQKMMRAATRYYAVCGTIVAILLIVIAFSASGLRQRSLDQKDKAVAEGLVEGLLNAEITEVPEIVEKMKGFRRFTDPQLRPVLDDPGSTERERLHARLALLPVDSEQCANLFDCALRADPIQLPVIAGLLKPHQDRLIGDFWGRAKAADGSSDERFRAACVLARFDPENSQWDSIARNTVSILVAEDFVHAIKWMDVLRPARQWLCRPLIAEFRDPAASKTTRTLAASILADYCQENVNTIAGLATEADAEAFAVFMPVFRDHREGAVSRFSEELSKKAPTLWEDAAADPSWTAVKHGSAAAIRRACGVLTESFAFCQTMPSASFESVAEDLRASGYRPSCFRPYVSPEGCLVAAVWLRDGRDWTIVQGQTAEAIRKQDVACREKGLYPVDLASSCSQADGEDHPVLFDALWAALGSDFVDARMYVEVPKDRHGEAWSPLNDAEFVPRANLLTRNRKGEECNSSVRWKLIAAPVYDDVWASPAAEYEEQAAKGWYQAEVRVTALPSGDRRYAAAWWSHTAGRQSRECHGLSLEEHREHCEGLAAEGYRPMSISVSWNPASGRFDTASVWYCPIVTEAAKDAFTKRQARAAVALLQLGEEAVFWPLLRQQDDPRLRTWLIHLLAPLGTDPGLLLEHLDEEREASIRQALLLSLAEYGDRLLPLDKDEAIKAKLVDVYRNDRDPGIHSAVDLVLRKLGFDLAALDMHQAFESPTGEDDRKWYHTREGHTMVIIDGPVEFQMGSPDAEPHRQRYMETRHHRRIDRSFAIASREVTVEQFLRFRRLHPYAASYSPEFTCPVNNVSWYDAVGYCRWLSEREGIPEAEWCYPPPEAIGEGMTMGPDYLEKTGYRLPTEAEWEYACRAKTSTSRYFGHADELLPRYAWNVDCSGYRTWPVGRLRPNDFGLFDMLGNVMEWCQDPLLSYPKDAGGQPVEDVADTAPVSDDDQRVLRGGACLYQPSNARSSHRDGYRPNNNKPFIGFRVARTWNETCYSAPKNPSVR